MLPGHSRSRSVPANQLEVAFREIRALLTSGRFRHLFIGGLAVLAAGEPRMTQDVDLILFVPKGRLPDFLGRAAKRGFRVNRRQAILDAESRGACAIAFGGVAVDIIIASTDFEESAWLRRRRVRLFGLVANVPAAEDLILLKMIPGRPRDLEDVKSIGLSSGSRLDRRYLRRWIEVLCDRAEDMRMLRQLEAMKIL